MAFMVRSEKPIREAFVAEPLKPGKTPVPFRALENGRYSVTVPKEALVNYAMVHLELAR